MNEQSFINDYAAKLVAGDFEEVHPHKQYAAGMHGRFSDLVAKLIAAARAAGLTWSKLFAVASQIYLVVSQGGNVQDIINAIWKIFFPVNPPPVPAISVP